MRVQTLDLSTQVGNIKGLWNDGPRLYIRGVMRDKVDTRREAAPRGLEARGEGVVLRDAGGVRLVWRYSGGRCADNGEDQDPSRAAQRECHVTFSGALLL